MVKTSNERLRLENLSDQKYSEQTEREPECRGIPHKGTDTKF